jgi:two-component system LytT family response regulator
MIRALIVDDEPLARRRLRSLLRREPDIEIIGEASNGQESVDVIRHERPDLVFLDIQMPQMDGFSVIEAIGVERMPYIIFITAYGQYALKAFDVRALDYLLKPFDHKRLEKALDQARRQLRLAGGHEELRKQVRGLLQETGPKVYPIERILVKSKGRIIILRTSDIGWIESAGNYLILHCGGESYLVRETMAEMEGKLDCRTFVRIHRSSIVNIDCIKEIQPSFHGEYDVVLKTGTKLVLSRTYSDKFKKIFARDS